MQHDASTKVKSCKYPRISEHLSSTSENSSYTIKIYIYIYIWYLMGILHQKSNVFRCNWTHTQEVLHDNLIGLTGSNRAWWKTWCISCPDFFAKMDLWQSIISKTCKHKQWTRMVQSIKNRSTDVKKTNMKQPNELYHTSKNTKVFFPSKE